MPYCPRRPSTGFPARVKLLAQALTKHAECNELRECRLATQREAHSSQIWRVPASNPSGQLAFNFPCKGLPCPSTKRCARRVQPVCGSCCQSASAVCQTRRDATLQGLPQDRQPSPHPPGKSFGLGSECLQPNCRCTRSRSLADNSESPAAVFPEPPSELLKEPAGLRGTLHNGCAMFSCLILHDSVVDAYLCYLTSLCSSASICTQADGKQNENSRTSSSRRTAAKAAVV